MNTHSDRRGSGRILTILGGAAFAGFLAIQFVRPTIAHPPVTAELEAPAEVRHVLRNSCYDCHSNETKLAWFDQIVPAYWVVANDVKRARSRLNFSEIGKLPLAQQKATLYEAISQIELGAMPLPPYARLHPSARMTPAQLDVLKNYLNPARVNSKTPDSDLAADDSQYQEWLRTGDAERTVQPVSNGIPFPRDYKNWKVINGTDRLDNQTMRAILGNPTAMQAIADGHTNPWPDGSTFAKVAWLSRDDGQGKVHAGAFFQVEFMIKDRNKYASTDGWGWARWRGAGLTPYGKNANFTAECTGCHAPLRDSDFVFTVPASMPQTPVKPREWNVITTMVDRPSSTMSTLFGNDIAVRYARANSQHDYPAGAQIALVTWTQQEDPRWFGASILAQVKSIETVTVSAGPDNRNTYSYELYEGSPAVKTSASEDHSSGSRADLLLSLRAAVLP
ncbi:MAG: cytochrome P460 family protein [Ignavibacteriota bacterium]